MNWKESFNILKETFSEWQEDKASRLAAALAYYTVFSLAPLVIIVLAIIKLLFAGDTAEAMFMDQIQSLVGETGAQFFQQIIEADNDQSANIIATLIGFVTLIFGATGVFAQLQDALNTVWEVEPNSDQGIWGFVKTRAVSFTVVLGVGFLLLVSLILSTGLSAFNTYVGQALGNTALVAQIVNQIISFGVITLLFAMIFKILPDVAIEWRDVWVGAAVTALLFSIGKFLIGLYLGNQGLGSTYGAAGSILVLLLWVYYSAQIMLFGAEFTQVYARRFGSHILPGETAHRVQAENSARREASSSTS
ncbi:MAG TPA: YihY/virulence factor BrkB family protein [Anaerolineae bacterium]|nr:YihY/virulence factor BrkB family protein [Anaerolineae bacterium]HMR65209.1 YihY/virulence factor BrkB family protein [Anaerolineae bacterium]